MSLKVSNFATAILAAPISAVDTEITITAGSEVNFPTLAAGDWTPIVVIDSSAHREIMRCTARNVNLLTVVRGQENTPSFSFAAGARVDGRLTAAALAEFVQKTAAANTLTGSLTLSGDAALARLRFTGTTGPWGFEFPTADVSFGVKTGVSGTSVNRFVWNEKPDLSGQDFMVLNAGDTAQLGVGMVPPIAGHSGVYSPLLSTNENVTFNAYYNTADSKWHFIQAGWATLITAPLSSNVLALYKSTVSGAANAAITWDNRLTFNTSKQAVFPAHVFAGGAYLDVNGNAVGPNPGSIWLNYGTGHVDAYSAVYNRIESRADAWAQVHANARFHSSRMAGAVDHTTVGGPGGFVEFGGYVMTGYQRADVNRYLFRWRQPQLYSNNTGWVVAFGY